jgi:Malectin domain/Bacterial TSP3 repeat/Fibronectin type III domain
MLYAILRQLLFRFISRHAGNFSTPTDLGLQGVRLGMLSLLLLLLASRAFAGQMTLQWDAVTNPQLAGYKVYYGYASRQYSMNVNAGMSTTAAFSNLKDAQMYYFAVTAFDTSGKESAFSNEVSYDLAKVDTDKDGLSDWDEINFYRTDPDRADTDGDGLSDGAEVNIYKTDPTKSDTDGDGISDGLEVSKGSNPLDPKSIPGTEALAFAVNAGGVQYTAGDATVFAADAKFSGGSIYTTTAAIAGTADDRLYQSERFGNFSYNIPVPNGDYEVTLKFAEIYWTSAGQRVFNVLIEGKTVISQLDLVAKVGPKAAYDVVVPVTVADGVLNITFQSVVENAKVSAIKVVPTEVIFAVNAGGPEYVDAADEVYDADANFSGGNTYSTTAAIAGTEDDKLYQSQRHGNFSYNIPVENGDYEVTLKFAEISHTSVGRRVFNVLIEGKTVISKLDLVAKVGPKAAYDVVVPITVADGVLNITFQSVVNNAKASAIKVAAK